MNAILDYETTCYIDKNDNLSGVLHLDSETHIDFDVRDIFYQSVPQRISSTYMRLLEELIINSPRVVKYDMLFDIYYGDRYDAVDADIQVLRNFKSKIDKYITIKNIVKEGYRVELKKKIKKIKVYRENVHDISELFSQHKQQEKKTEDGVRLISNKTSTESTTTLEFSGKFFCGGARSLSGASGEQLIDELGKLSSVFHKITHIERIDDTNNEAVSNNVVVDAYNHVVPSCKNSQAKEILKIKGPLGSYKNRIMQYLYLTIEKNHKEILPFYINIASYENKTAYMNDIEIVKDIIAKEPNKTLLLMLDGIRDFSCGKESMYYAVRESIKNLDCKLVVCLDSDFTVNNQHRFKVHPLVSSEFEMYMRISSMNLYRREESIDFVGKCIEVFGAKVSKNVTPEMIYDSLVRLNFISLDAYWLVYVLNTAIRDIINVKNNISDIYYSICLSVLGTHQNVDSVAELAYEFEFGSVDFDNTDACFGMWWGLVRNHRSVLDFLIAKQYIKKVSELNLKIGNRSDNIKSLSFFNMVLQKNITRFVVTMLNGIDDYEHQIMIIANDYYDALSLFGKSELTFWMARLQNPKRKKESVYLLQDYKRKELERYEQNQFNSIEEKRDAAFLLRGISVSLIYENDKEALKYYLNSLLTDKIANSVNRGFHLEYYGDKPYIPNKTLLDFEDDITKGENTLTVLCLSLDRRMKKHDVSSYVAILEIMTICNLIQARIEEKAGGNTLNVFPYVEKCIQYLDWITKQRNVRNLKNVKDYFDWMRSELSHLFDAANNAKANRLTYYAANPFNKFSQASTVERTGWVKSGIPYPENIVEHMYNCWLIGMLYLPDKYDIEGYDKNEILRMLLIHDLGETETGDINRPEKEKNRDYYGQEENKVMQAFLLTGTYPSSVNLKAYLSCWDKWDEKENINYFIAKDIDNIQTIYQFCSYYLMYPNKLTEKDVLYWLKGVNEVETDIGREIAEILITRNPQYTDIVKIVCMNEN